MNPVDRNGDLTAYLLKILTVIVKRAGEIRIDAVDMLDEPNGNGISKFYDREKKQLVLSYIREGSEIYINNKLEDNQWQRKRSSRVQPLLKSDLMEDSTSDQGRSSSTLDDQRLSLLEDNYRKEAAARILANFPGTPVTSPSEEPRRVQPSFYKG